jgi:hypothetical protein
VNRYGEVGQYLGKAGTMSTMERYLHDHNGIATPRLEAGGGSQKLLTDKIHWKAVNGNTRELEETKTKSSKRKT